MHIFFNSMLKQLFISLLLFLFCQIGTAQIDVIGAKKINLDIETNSMKVPYYSNYLIDETNEDVKSAVIVIHGTNRNADDYFETLTTAAAMRPGKTDSTIIIAPQFLIEEDIDFHNLDEDHLYWSNSGWKSGSYSRDEVSNPRPARISSFAVIDTILLRLNNNCPNLSSIIITGHSAGGQFTNRYAATTPMANIICEQFETSIKFIIANPSSYVYLDSRRKVAGTIDQFAPPDNDCPGYNEWKYGLNNLYTYPANVGVNYIRENYGKRNVVYLLGENDNNPNSSDLDISCEAMLQGIHRLERGSVYFNYLIDFYGNDILNKHSLDTVPEVGHDNFGIYTSSIGLFHLFESKADFCINHLSQQLSPKADHKILVYPNPSRGIFNINFGEDLLLSSFKLEVYNLLNQRILVENNQTKIDLKNLCPGTYLLKLKIDKEMIMQKLILIN